MGGGSFHSGPSPGDEHPGPDRTGPGRGRPVRAGTAFRCRRLRSGHVILVEGASLRRHQIRYSFLNIG
ncbi:hypothetical protein HMPREF1549_03050 [Actinomyces johnsonii F0510]|uniref:Uncharacterized protein n=1 Tax=Actinomyces johnsonii F0510 TaxID=1227262 RepID=U1R7L6_9ACTO|nr:hypothetical protein HMPREF1549_03050 [Actinomyces johnsonii F0510]